MSTDEPQTRVRAPRLGLPVAERLLRRFKDAAQAAQMSTQRATNEALKAWMASRPAEEQRGMAIKASLRALAASENQKRLTRSAARRAKQKSAPEEDVRPHDKDQIASACRACQRLPVGGCRSAYVGRRPGQSRAPLLRPRWPHLGCQCLRDECYKRQKPHETREALRVLTLAGADRNEQVWCSNESYTHL